MDVYQIFLLLSLTPLVATDIWADNGIDVFCNKELYRRKVEREGCVTQQFVVYACLGNCRSYQKPLIDNPYFQSMCQSCRAGQTEMKQFTLDTCRSGIDKSVSIESAVSCSCQNSDNCS